MNLPDITLIFQMVHFLMAYVILRKFVFTPSLLILEQQEEKNHRYHQKIHHARQNLQDFFQEQNQRWYFIKQSLMDMSPVIGIKKCVTRFKVTAPVEIEKKALSSEQQESIKKVLHKKLLDMK